MVTRDWSLAVAGVFSTVRGPPARRIERSRGSSNAMKASDIRRGHVIMVDGQPCRVMDFQHRTPGNLRAFVQVRFRNLNSGNTFDTRLSATEFVEDARLDTKELQVLYRDANGVHVMDAGSYEQYTLDEEAIGDQGQWLEPGLTFQAEWLDGRPIAIQLPAVAELEVVETAPIMKTATKTASTKPAKLSNGVTIQVPEFINEGERVRVNPREGVYLERAK
jgi:elongation factor P